VVPLHKAESSGEDDKKGEQWRRRGITRRDKESAKECRISGQDDNQEDGDDGNALHESRGRVLNTSECLL